MTIRDLISGEVGTTTPSTSAVDAARHMIEDNVGSLAVVDGDGELVGIITERDFLRALAEGTLRGAQVADLMTPRPDSLDVEVSVREAAEWMVAAGYRHLPVLDGTRLVGMVSVKDVVWALLEGS
jgi:CBS domain-containing protein